MATAIPRRLPRIPSYALPPDATCPICTHPFENQTTDTGTFEKAVVLPCPANHVFGHECLSTWLYHGQTCPLCRSTLPLPAPNFKTSTQNNNTDSYYFIFALDENAFQDWDAYWYTTFWLLHLHAHPPTTQAWAQYQHDWHLAATTWNAEVRTHTIAALSASRQTPSALLSDENQIRISGAAIQTLRFREYLLYLQFQPNASDRPELKAPPEYQLTRAQEDVLFRELERRGAFLGPEGERRREWEGLRAVGFVWFPCWEVGWRGSGGRWSRFAC